MTSVQYFCLNSVLKNKALVQHRPLPEGVSESSGFTLYPEYDPDHSKNVTTKNRRSAR